MKRISFQKVLAFFKNESGIGLLETLVAIAIIGACGVGFLSATNTSTKTVGLVEERVDVDNLARAQLEFTKNDSFSYDFSYEALDELSPGDDYYVTLPRNYDIIVLSSPLHESEDEDIQLITVTIQYGGEDLLQVEGYKVNR